MFFFLNHNLVITIVYCVLIVRICLKILRGCSYGGELARLGRLAHLGEISTSLRNSYKNIICSYEKWDSLPRWDLTWFCRDPTKMGWKFSIWTHVSGLARNSRTEFSWISFFFRCWLNNIRTFVLHEQTDILP